MGIAETSAFTAAIIMLILAELINYKLIIGKQVPTLEIASYIAPVLGTIFSILILLAIYSATSSLLLMTARINDPRRSDS